MASIQKRDRKPKPWRAEVCINGVRKSKSFLTKTEAKVWAAEMTTRAHSHEHGSTNSNMSGRGDFTVDDLLVRYLKDVTPTHKGARFEQKRIEFFRRNDLARVPLEKLCADDIVAFRNERLKTVSNSSVNRELNILSSMFSIAVREWKVGLTSNPVRDVKRPKENPHREVIITDSERDEIVAELRSKKPGRRKGQAGRHIEARGERGESVNEIVAEMFLFALETCMRLGEISAIKRSWCREGYVALPREVTKTQTARQVPLTRTAQNILAKRSVMQRPFPVDPNTASAIFRKAKKAVGLHHIRFHDARHTAITRLADDEKANLSMLQLSAISGHSDPRMLKRYYNPKPERLAAKIAHL